MDWVNVIFKGWEVLFLKILINRDLFFKNFFNKVGKKFLENFVFMDKWLFILVIVFVLVIILLLGFKVMKIVVKVGLYLMLYFIINI